jgi:hypothetical protein
MPSWHPALETWSVETAETPDRHTISAPTYVPEKKTLTINHCLGGVAVCSFDLLFLYFILICLFVCLFHLDDDVEWIDNSLRDLLIVLFIAVWGRQLEM